MKKIFTIISILLVTASARAQQNYCDFEGAKNASLAEWNGVMDSTHINPAPNAVNSSSFCAKYIRDTALFDNFKLFPYTKLTDVTPYASPSATQKMTMKIFTSSAPGVEVILQLGTRTTTTYPAGVHSIYSATTTTQNAWETLTFNYLSTPPGSTMQPTDVDKIVFFVRWNSHARDTIFFDDPTGPMATVMGIKENNPEPMGIRDLRNEPNPAGENTSIKFTLGSAGEVKWAIHDMLGKKIVANDNRFMSAGEQSLFINTREIPPGVYFYTLQFKEQNITRKITISK